MRTFKVNNKISFVCDTLSGGRNYAFRHKATLLKNGRGVDSTSVGYLNRTWESYEYQSVMQKLVDKTNALSSAEKKMVKTYLKKSHTDWSGMRSIGMVAKMGELIGGETQKEKNVWKQRMIKAGLGDAIQMPEGWDKLPEGIKTKRLDMVTNMLLKSGMKNQVKKKVNKRRKKK